VLPFTTPISGHYRCPGWRVGAEDGCCPSKVFTVSATSIDELRSGRFWDANAPERTIPGWLDLSGRWPVLHLGEPLTAPWKVVSRTESDDGTVATSFGFADDGPERMASTVHGQLRGPGPAAVTLIGAWSAGHRQVFGLPHHDPGSQTLQAQYALLGGHEPAGSRVIAARLRLRHLDVWAPMPGMSLTTAEDGSQVGLSWQRPSEWSSTLQVPDGILSVDPVVNMQWPTTAGGTLQVASWLEVHDLAGLSVGEVFDQLAGPLSTLATLTADAPCPPVALELQTELSGDSWLTLEHPALEATDAQPLEPHRMLLSLPMVGLDVAARWLVLSRELRPLPRVIAAATPGDRLVESQLLELCVVAESLHRRGLPQDPRMSAVEADQIRRTVAGALAELPVPGAVMVKDLLGHLEEPGYRQRLRELAARAEPAVPGVVGLRTKWLGEIYDARNGFAHTYGSSGGTAQAYLTLLISLRWVLTGVLLMEAGIPADLLAGRLANHQPYQTFLDQARDWLPHVYPTVASG